MAIAGVVTDADAEDGEEDAEVPRDVADVADDFRSEDDFESDFVDAAVDADVCDLASVVDSRDFESDDEA